jgi:outer membrane receptor for ferrienterochelin and colicin
MSLGIRSTTNSNLTGGVGATVTGTIFPWWVQQATLGRSSSDGEITQKSPLYVTPSDSLNRGFRRSYQLLNAAYNTTVRGSLSGLSGVLTLGFDGTNARLHAANGYAVNLILPTVSYVNTSVVNSLDRVRGGFVQGQLSVHDALFFTYGLRGEHSSLYGGRYGVSYSPRYGVSYVGTVGPVTAKLRAAYGYGTRPPTRDQIFAQYRDAGNLFGVIPTQYASPNLGPESQQGGEGGIDLYISNVASVTVTVYNQTVDNLIEGFEVDTIYSEVLPTARQFVIQYYNAANIRNRGAELSANVNHGPWSVRGVYSYTRSRILSVLDSAAHLTKIRVGGGLHPGDAITYLPEHTWHVEAGYATSNTSLLLFVDGVSRTPRFIVRPGIPYIGDRNRYWGGDAQRTYQSFPNAPMEGPAYATLGVRAQHRIFKTVDVTVQVENLTNQYQNDDWERVPVLGRQGSVGVRLRL